MNRAIWILATLAACSLQTGLQARADDANDTRSVSPLRHWAVIADPVLRKTGLSDLVNAELTSRGVLLVEREQIDRVLREVELTQCFGATGASKRASVGQLLGADAIVLLRQLEHEGVPFLQLIVSDCLVGARLHVSHFDLAQNKVDELSTAVSAEILSTRQRFARQLCIVRTSIDGKRIEQLKRSRPRLQVFKYLRY